jgi:hypothetical protein
MKVDLSKRQIDYFISAIGEDELRLFLNNKKVRDKLIQIEFYKLIQELSNMAAYDKLANDFRLSRIAIIKIVANL